MSTVKKYNWNDVHSDQLTPLLSRKMITCERLMIAEVLLTKGSIVPAHDHHNEQITYILKGCLRFWIGEHADAPGDVYVDVHAGEVLTIPGMVRHRAVAIEDTIDIDVFNPPRQDWLDGSATYFQNEK